MRLRQEPFRLLFPIGVLLAWAGVAPWLLFGTGLMRAWPGTFHALTMTQAFLLAISVGFLGTMIPRRTGTPPMSALELGLAAVGVAAIPVAVAFGRLAAAELSYLIVIATLAQFAVRRMRRVAAPRPPVPPSFLFIPAGLIGGAAGAGLLIAFSFGASPWTLGLGRALVQEALLLALVLALGPMLTPLILHGQAPPEPTRAAWKRTVRFHALAAAALLASFPIQHAVWERGGLLLRGLVLALEVVLAARVQVAPTVSGLHRRLYRLALLFVPLGPLTAGIWPALRIPAMHLTFVGGLSLLVFAVSLHVAFLHTGRERSASASPWPVALVGALTLCAVVARVSAERFSEHYFEALTVAASLWLGAALFWGLFLVEMVASKRREQPAR